jgi:ectoine hydroxylase-related dioxygenase (phytanoyl-CoA dioxygenase family)
MRMLVRQLRARWQFFLDVVRLLGGAVMYRFTGNTSPAAHQAFVRLFCLSRGLSNDWMHRVVVTLDGGCTLPQPRGLLGVRTVKDADQIADSIRRNGYHVFDQKLPSDMCDRLLAFAMTTPASLRPMTGEEGPRKNDEIYDRTHPKTVRYDFHVGDVLEHPDVQGLMADPSILMVSQSYLRTTPIADVTSMWWHTAFSDQPDEEAAQFFHFDLDRIKWLKFFIYLSDVGPDNGPHCFIRGSHRRNGIPAALLAKGYARLKDEEVFRHYARDDEVQFLAPRGTVIVEDTRGLHKGLPVTNGDRLMLQLQFSDSLFGGTYPKINFGKVLAPDLASMISRHGRIYSNYTS